MEKSFIFGVLNQCRGYLAGCSTHLILLSQRYPVSGHPRTKELSIRLGHPAKVTSLNCSKDGRIFISHTTVISNPYSDPDKGARERCTLIQKIIGTSKSCRHRRGRNSKGLFVGAFSLLFLSLLSRYWFSLSFLCFFSLLWIVTKALYNKLIKIYG